MYFSTEEQQPTATKILLEEALRYVLLSFSVYTSLACSTQVWHLSAPARTMVFSSIHPFFVKKCVHHTGHFRPTFHLPSSRSLLSLSKNTLFSPQLLCAPLPAQVVCLTWRITCAKSMQALRLRNPFSMTTYTERIICGNHGIPKLDQNDAIMIVFAL